MFRTLIVLGMSALFLLPTPAFADLREGIETKDSADALFGRKQYAMAEKEYKKALSEFGAEPSLPVADIWKSLALISEIQNKPGESADRWLQHMHFLKLSTDGREQPVLWTRVGALRLEQGQTALGQEILLRALRMHGQQPLQTVSPDIVKDPEKLALLYLDNVRGFYFATEEEAIPLLEYVYKSRKKNLSFSNQLTIRAGNELARAYFAREHYQDAVSVLSELLRAPADKGSSRVETLAQFANTEYKMHAFVAADQYARQAAAAASSTSGSERAAASKTLLELAQTFSQPGSYATSQFLQSTVRKIGSGTVAQQANFDLVSSYEKTGQTSKQEQELKSNVQRNRAAGSEAYGMAMVQLAEFYAKNKKLTLAEQQYAAGIDALKESKKPLRRFTASLLLEEAANVYAEDKQYAKAEPLYQRAIALWSATESKAGSVTALEHYAELLAATGRKSDADAMMQKAHDILSAEGGPCHTVVLPFNAADTVTDW